jgi:dienelactone hydrolase
VNSPEDGPQAHYFQTAKTARYYLLGDTTHATEVWVCLHGYGMLPKYWLRKLQPLLTPGVLVVVPEALSRFYLDDTHQRVGASWMTREDRLTDVVDYVAYLDGLLRHLQASLPNMPAHVNVLGFSQGAATAWRWVAQGQASVEHLVIWAGEVPCEECPLPRHPVRMSLVCGQEDPYFPKARWEAHAALLQAQGYAPQRFTFAGGHTLHAQVLVQLPRL